MVSPNNQGDAGFEIVFHEASHTVDVAITQSLEAEARRQGVERDWQPWLDGTVPFEETLRNLVRDATR